ncbi:VCBS repeat-containing protein [Prosthecobacter sp. SYSU 5D2]|uniref:FG-GAP repeat domain-containing protein n=1 Tax=Prosthecobacter sp. SYSU 5D2 TaxID=3134134 RepID=UPI0031FE74CC
MNLKLRLLMLTGMAASGFGLKLQAAEVAWEGRGQYRVLLEVAPVNLGGRATDELVASYDLDVNTAGKDMPKDRALDFDSVQVMRYSPETGRAEKYADHAYRTSEYDRPFQFYDATYPEDFPNYERYLSHQKANPFQRPKAVPFGARHFNAIGDGRKGRIVWPHTQEGQDPSWYAIYFDLLPTGKEPDSPPAGFVGDGSPRMLRESNRFGPTGNINGRVVDWNHDGLPDLFFGSATGHLSLYLNSGEPGQPRFRSKKLLLDHEGVPIDVGFSSCPWVADWNGDGKNDLLVGAEKGCVVWYENVGSEDEPSFRFAGFLEEEGRMIVTPAKPIAEGHGEEAFKEDYFPVPQAVDWDGDGDLDLLLGGYVTGLTFYYENVGQEGSLPVLKSRGPLTDAEGQVIDTGWMAAPAAADLDGDGDLDLVLGGKPVNEGSGDMRDSSRAILYYANNGTREAAVLVRTPFPANAAPPFGGMVVPSLADWDGDGLTDLVVVDIRQQVTAFRNLGTSTQPLFDFKERPLKGAWQAEGIYVNSFQDVNGDGHPDVLNGFNVMLNSGEPSPRFFPKRLSFTAGKVIKHPVPHGDENPGIILHDFNGDGMLDGIYGAHSGHLWFHVNRGTNDRPDLEPTGVQLRLVTGAALKVGLPEGAKAEKVDFTVLQGARPKPVAADFDQDGLPDLIVGDAYGKVRYYENLGSRTEPLFAEPVLIEDRGSRLFLGTLDWNGDGVPDLAVIKGGIRVFVNRGRPGQCEFLPPEEIQVPSPQSYLLSVSAIDWNQDGDDDLLYLSADGSFCFAERSFLKFGYLAGQQIAVETKKR